MAGNAEHGLAIAGLALCLLLPAFLPASWQGALEYQRAAILEGQIWRLWSGHLVHFTVAQAALDALACLVSWAWLWHAGDGRRLAAGLLLTMPIIALGLVLLVPNLATYRGASGLAMFLALPALFLAWSERPGLRPLLALLGVAVGDKVIGEALGLELAAVDLPTEVRVVWQAHALGLGLLLAGVIGFGGRPGRALVAPAPPA